jgi:hypothetical protein
MKKKIKAILLTDQEDSEMIIHAIEGLKCFCISIGGCDFVFNQDEKDELFEAINQITE